jgi:hypothetical protein
MQRVANPVILPWFYFMWGAFFFLGSTQNFFIYYTISSTDLHPSPAHMETFKKVTNNNKS